MEILDFKSFTLDLVSRKLFVSGQYIYLRNKEFSLLEYFIKNIGKVLSRTRILEEVWDRNILCPTNTVDVHVSSLRKKIKSCENVDFIRTVPCVGYVFEKNY
ncbi:MAG: winged helix-turn-helix domain-containing protein [Candidatus Peregrinibacteria bacterium]|nr:winged helix-turn-helix domain-containing protein [Candidatus Peregrinibacteria bacterium]